MKCPRCGCLRFYVKDPDDEYSFFNFSYSEAGVVFDPDVDPDEAPDVDESAEIYCEKCSWHGKLGELV